MSRQGAREDERGFTLVELMLVIIVMGILFAIASSTWFGAVESRRVDSATSQLAADLRQAHSRAINRLEPQTVTLTTDSSQYTMILGVANPVDLDEDLRRQRGGCQPRSNRRVLSQRIGRDTACHYRLF